MDKFKSTVLMTVCSASFVAPAALAVDHGHHGPLLTPIICDANGNYPADGSSSRIINDPHSHQFVLSLRHPSESRDGVGEGGRIDANGLPANFFAVTVKGDEVFFNIITNEPGTGEVEHDFVPVTVTKTFPGGAVRLVSNLSILNLPAGTTFKRIYIWQTQAPASSTARDFIVDGFAVFPSGNPLAFDCTGTSL